MISTNGASNTLITLISKASHRQLFRVGIACGEGAGYCTIRLSRDHCHAASFGASRRIEHNMARVAALTESIPWIAESCLKFQLRLDMARMNVLGSLERLSLDHPRYGELVAELDRLRGIPTENEEMYSPLFVGHSMIAIL